MIAVGSKIKTTHNTKSTQTTFKMTRAITMVILNFSKRKPQELGPCPYHLSLNSGGWYVVVIRLFAFLEAETKFHQGSFQAGFALQGAFSGSFL